MHKRPRLIAHGRLLNTTCYCDCLPLTTTPPGLTPPGHQARGGRTSIAPTAHFARARTRERASARNSIVFPLFKWSRAFAPSRARAFALCCLLLFPAFALRALAPSRGRDLAGLFWRRCLFYRNVQRANDLPRHLGCTYPCYHGHLQTAIRSVPPIAPAAGAACCAPPVPHQSGNPRCRVHRARSRRASSADRPDHPPVCARPRARAAAHTIRYVSASRHPVVREQPGMRACEAAKPGWGRCHPTFAGLHAPMRSLAQPHSE